MTTKIAEEARSRKKKLTQYDRRSLRNRRPKVDKVMKVFIEEVDLPEFKEALNYSKDPRFRMLFEAISAPTLHKCSFAELCRRCGLSIHDISAIYRDHQKHRGLMRAYKHMPKILEDTAIDAQSRDVPCDVCGETGKVGERDSMNRQKIGICPRCHGDGKYRIIGDKDSRNLIFESAGLRKGSVQTAVQVNVGGRIPTLEDTIGEVEGALDIEAEESDAGNNGAGGNGEADEGNQEIEEGS